MSRSSVRADGVRPPGAPSYIEARQRADRYSRVRARLLIVVALVHVAYLIVPILPCARCRTVVSWWLLLPPLCATLVLLSLIVSIRRWVWSRRQATQLIHLPPLQEGS